MDAPTVTVKLFAALRDAAGVGETHVEIPTTVADVLSQLAERFGDRFAQRMRIAAVMVDGDPVDPDSTDPLPAGCEVALLPPFAGG